MYRVLLVLRFVSIPGIPRAICQIPVHREKPCDYAQMDESFEDIDRKILWTEVSDAGKAPPV